MPDFYLSNRPRMWQGSPALESVTEYTGVDRLVIACGPMASATRQKKLVREWCDFLPTATSLKALFIVNKASQDLFEAACSVPNLEAFEVKWSSIKDLSPIDKAQRLWYLDIGSSPSAANVHVIGRLEGLRVLALENIRSAFDLCWLPNLKKLEELAVSGSMYTTQRIDSLKPLAALTNLRHLQLANTRAEQPDSIHDLRTLQKLELLSIAHWWPKHHVRFLIEHLPRLKVTDWPWD